MTPPFPPLPVGAPANIQDSYNAACQAWERELMAKNILRTLPPDASPQDRHAKQTDYAFAQNETFNASSLYIDALVKAGYSDDDDTRLTA